MLHTGRYLRFLFLQRTKRHPPITIATMIETAIATTAMLAWLEVASGGGVEWVPGPSEAGSTTLLLGVRREGGRGKEGEGRREREGGRGKEGEGRREREGGRGKEGEGRREREGGRGKEGEGRRATHRLNDEHGYRLQDEYIGCKVTCHMWDMAV